MSRESMELQSSWILELRDRFAGEPSTEVSGNGHRVVFFVPLYVEGGQLWTILVEGSAPEPGGLSPIGFPATESEPAEPPWSAAARAAAEVLRLPTEQVLRVGELAERRGLGDIRYLPCVGAIPTPEVLPTTEVEVVALPLLAIRSPQLTERRQLKVAGEVVLIEVAHVGGHKLWGPAAEILDDLLSRLGLGH